MAEKQTNLTSDQIGQALSLEELIQFVGGSALVPNGNCALELDHVSGGSSSWQFLSLCDGTSSGNCEFVLPK